MTIKGEVNYVLARRLKEAMYLEYGQFLGPDKFLSREHFHPSNPGLMLKLADFW